jgi:hypothetical protein
MCLELIASCVAGDAEAITDPEEGFGNCITWYERFGQ